MTKKVITETNRKESARLKTLYREASRQTGITQEAIAENLGVSQGAVSHYLNGHNALNLNAAVAFSRLLGVAVADFSPRLARELDGCTGRTAHSQLNAALADLSEEELREVMAQIELIKRRKRGEI